MPKNSDVNKIDDRTFLKSHDRKQPGRKPRKVKPINRSSERGRIVPLKSAKSTANLTSRKALRAGMLRRDF